MTIHEEIAKVSKSLMFEEPFYGMFLITLNKIIDEKVGTAGVSKNGINCQLAIAPKFWGSLSEDHRKGLLKHELLHIVFFHLSFRDSFSDKILFNIAADIEINQYIAKHMLPEGGCTIDSENFKHLNLIPFNGTRYYYDELYKAKQAGDPKINAFYAACENFKKGTGQPQRGPGKSGDGTGEIIPDHSSWDEFEGLSDAEKELIKKQVDYQVKDIIENNQKNCGKIPGELQTYIDSLFKVKEPVFDWKAYLRRFVGASTKIYTKKTRRKLNKRFSGLPAIKIKMKNHILVAVDTSGSVSDRELEEFFSEIHHMHKTGVTITVAQCDADIHDIREYTGKFDGRICGRGGTNFQPVIDYYDENKKKYSTLIFLTDGYCGMPTTPRGSMMWVMSSNSQPLDTFKEWPGFKIRIPNVKA